MFSVVHTSNVRQSSPIKRYFKLVYKDEMIVIYIVSYPARTAKTPAFGRGLSTRWATSPQANTEGVLRLCKASCSCSTVQYSERNRWSGE